MVQATTKPVFGHFDDEISCYQEQDPEGIVTYAGNQNLTQLAKNHCNYGSTNLPEVGCEDYVIERFVIVDNFQSPCEHAQDSKICFDCVSDKNFYREFKQISMLVVMILTIPVALLYILVAGALSFFLNRRWGPKWLYILCIVSVLLSGSLFFVLSFFRYTF